MSTGRRPDTDATNGRAAQSGGGATRRGFLRAVGGAAGVGALGGAWGRAEGSIIPARGRARIGRGTAQNLILMVADGMSSGTLTLADRYSHEAEGRALFWTRAWGMAEWTRGMQSTSSQDSLVTDSAAASSAWSCGEKFPNESICVRADGSEAMPVWLAAKENGKATGLVTTTRVTHATPAGFACNVKQRDMEDRIAVQLLDRGIDVILGGGAKYFPDTVLAAHTGVKVVRTAAELAAARASGPAAGGTASKGSDRLLGLFGNEHVGFVMDRGADVPGLTDMSLTALERLAARPGGFVLQIEGGRVDHAGHNNDAAAIVREMIEFDRCVEAVSAWAIARGDTLVIVTTDHATGNPGLTRYGPKVRERMVRMTGAKRSFEWIEQRLAGVTGRAEAAQRLPGLLEEASGTELNPAQHDALTRWGRGESVNLFPDANEVMPLMGSVLADAFGVAWASPHHTGDHVEVLSTGPGSELLGGFIENTDMLAVMERALDMKPAREMKHAP